VRACAVRALLRALSRGYAPLLVLIPVFMREVALHGVIACGVVQADDKKTIFVWLYPAQDPLHHLVTHPPCSYVHRQPLPALSYLFYISLFCSLPPSPSCPLAPAHSNSPESPSTVPTAFAPPRRAASTPTPVSEVLLVSPIAINVAVADCRTVAQPNADWSLASPPALTQQSSPRVL
jgi:hypothetical protein